MPARSIAPLEYDPAGVMIEGRGLSPGDLRELTPKLDKARSFDEASLGQFFQMMMLATAVEGRLIGVNPYGQPGVEAYKKHMNANLRK
jgi:hypothetical protein